MIRFCKLAFFALIFLCELSSNLFALNSFYNDIPAITHTLAGQSQRRPFKLRNLNNSLQSMAIASQAIKRRDYEKAEESLNQAISSYKSNSLAYYMKAYVLSRNNGKKMEEIEALKKFLLLSESSYSEFEEQFISAALFFRIRDHVSAHLGIKIDDTEFHEKSWRDQLALIFQRGDIANVVFLAIILGGGIFILISFITGVNFSGLFSNLLIALYLSVLISYGLWMCDLAFEILPFNVNLWLVIPASFGVMAVPIIFSHVSEKIEEANIPLEEGYRRCPKCRAVIEQLLIECPECKKPIKSR